MTEPMKDVVALVFIGVWGSTVDSLLGHSGVGRLGRVLCGVAAVICVTALVGWRMHYWSVVGPEWDAD